MPGLFILERPNLSTEFFKEFAKQYGPFAFGVITLLIVWMSIINPFVDRYNLDFEAQRKILEAQNTTLDSLRTVQRDQEKLSETLSETSGNLRETAVILERIFDEVDAHKALP